MSAAAGLAIGVTGHRVLAETDRIEKGIDEALAAIRDRFSERALTVVSSLLVSVVKPLCQPVP